MVIDGMLVYPNIKFKLKRNKTYWNKTNPIFELFFSKINKQLICCCHLEHSPGLFYYFWFCFVLFWLLLCHFDFISEITALTTKNPDKEINIKTKYCSVSVTIINKRLLSTHSWHRYLQAIDAFHSNLVI